MPGLLPSLPPDPYTGLPFRYCRSGERKLLPLGLSGLVRPLLGKSSWSQRTRPGQMFLYSVGPNRIDHEVLADYQTNPARGELIFPLP